MVHGTSSAVASSSVSGTITYAGTKAGRTIIRVRDAACVTGCQNYAVVTLPDQGGAYTAVPFTIRGLRQTGSNGMPTNYVLKAYIDNLGTGSNNKADPGGSSATFTTVAGINSTGKNITVTDPGVITPVTPTGVNVFPGNNAALIVYTPPVDASGKEISSSYKIYTGTDAAATNGTTATFTAQGTNQTVYVMQGLANSSVLYFKMTGLSGAAESAASSISGPVTIGDTTGANTVSGTVTYPGTATGPMMVGLFSDVTGVYFTTIATPSSGVSYSVSGIPNGDYFSFAVIDNNNNSIIDAGDISNANGNGGGSLSVTGNVAGNTIALTSAGAIATVNSDHQFDGVGDSYTLIPRVNDENKRVVSATIISGPNLPVPFDIGPTNNNCCLWFSLGTTNPGGETYVYRVTYSDDLTEDMTSTVATPLNTYAQNLVAVTDGTSGSSTSVPLFTWSAPAAPPVPYTYSLNLWENGGSGSWYYPQNNDMPSSQTSVLYNFDGNAATPTLTTGTPGLYNWQIQVRDANGNSATRTATYP